MSHPISSAHAHAEPTPYELYIRLNPLKALWPKDPSCWAGEVIVSCGFQAAELTLRLIEDALGDHRPAACADGRAARYAEHLVLGVELTCRLLRKLPPAPPSLHAANVGLRRNASVGFSILASLPPEQRDPLVARLSLAGANLPFELGIHDELRLAGRGSKLASLVAASQGSGAPVLDYQALVSPDALYELREPTPFGPEDHLFSTVHQITECWLNIALHYVAAAHELAESNLWAAAADAMTNACAVLPLAIGAGQLLDQLVLADYHPLRVSLRDGSGAQSRAARSLGPTIRAAAGVLWMSLESENLRLLDILQEPNAHVGRYRYLTSLKSAGRQVQSYLFHHYLLALSVLGTHSFGSLGYEIRELAERAVTPLFPQLNEAHHDYVMLTNFEFGDSSGAIVHHNELASGLDPYAIAEQPTGCPRGVVEQQVRAYFRAIQDHDAEAWVDLFDPVRGQVHDVLGTRPYLGKERVSVFIRGMFRAFREMHAVCSPPHIDGNTASVEWRFNAVSYHGVPTLLSGREEFLFDGSGRILKAVAHWQPADVAKQWQQQLQSRVPHASARSPRQSYIASLRPTEGQASTAEAEKASKASA